MGSHTNTTNQLGTRKKHIVPRKSSPKRGTKMVGGMAPNEFKDKSRQEQTRIIQEFLKGKGYPDTVYKNVVVSRRMRNRRCGNNNDYIKCILEYVAGQIIHKECNNQVETSKRLATELQKGLVASLSGVSSSTHQDTSGTMSSSTTTRQVPISSAMPITQQQQQQQQNVGSRSTSIFSQNKSVSTSNLDSLVNEAHKKEDSAVVASTNTAISTLDMVLQTSLATLQENRKAAAELNIQNTAPGITYEEKAKLDQQIQQLQQDNEKLKTSITEQQTHKDELETLKKEHNKLIEEKANVETELQKARSNNQTGKVNELTNKLSQFQSEIDKLNTETKEEIEKAKEQNKELTTQLSARNTKSAANNAKIRDLEAKLKVFEEAEKKMKEAEAARKQLEEEAAAKKAAEEAEQKKQEAEAVRLAAEETDRKQKAQQANNTWKQKSDNEKINAKAANNKVIEEIQEKYNKQFDAISDFLSGNSTAENVNTQLEELEKLAGEFKKINDPFVKRAKGLSIMVNIFELLDVEHKSISQNGGTVDVVGSDVSPVIHNENKGINPSTSQEGNKITQEQKTEVIKRLAAIYNSILNELNLLDTTLKGKNKTTDAEITKQIKANNLRLSANNIANPEHLKSVYENLRGYMWVKPAMNMETEDAKELEKMGKKTINELSEDDKTKLRAHFEREIEEYKKLAAEIEPFYADIEANLFKKKNTEESTNKEPKKTLNEKLDVLKSLNDSSINYQLIGINKATDTKQTEKEIDIIISDHAIEYETMISKYEKFLEYLNNPTNKEKELPRDLEIEFWAEVDAVLKPGPVKPTTPLQSATKKDLTEEELTEKLNSNHELKKEIEAYLANPNRKVDELDDLKLENSFTFKDINGLVNIVLAEKKANLPDNVKAILSDYENLKKTNITDLDEIKKQQKINEIDAKYKELTDALKEKGLLARNILFDNKPANEQKKEEKKIQTEKTPEEKQAAEIAFKNTQIEECNKFIESINSRIDRITKLKEKCKEDQCTPNTELFTNTQLQKIFYIIDKKNKISNLSKLNDVEFTKDEMVLGWKPKEITDEVRTDREKLAIKRTILLESLFNDNTGKFNKFEINTTTDTTADTTVGFNPELHEILYNFDNFTQKLLKRYYEKKLANTFAASTNTGVINKPKISSSENRVLTKSTADMKEILLKFIKSVQEDTEFKNLQKLITDTIIEKPSQLIKKIFDEIKNNTKKPEHEKIKLDTEITITKIKKDAILSLPQFNTIVDKIPNIITSIHSTVDKPQKDKIINDFIKQIETEIKKLTNDELSLNDFNDAEIKHFYDKYKSMLNQITKNIEHLETLSHIPLKDAGKNKKNIINKISSLKQILGKTGGKLITHRKSATHKKRHTHKRLQMVPQTLKLTRRTK